VSISAAQFQAQQTEKAFMQAVLDLARLLGWTCYHTHDSRRSDPGFPDICCIKPHRLIFWECKTERGQLSRRQTWWFEQLCTIPGVTAGVIRPSDWDAIEATLRGSP
jgi:hypothetical protein